MPFLDEWDDVGEKSRLFSYILIFRNCPSFVLDFWKIIQGEYKKSKYKKNSPEMNDSERDMIPVKILSRSADKQKSYSM